eukprot:3279605-Amphidinium_carterae.2
MFCGSEADGVASKPHHFQHSPVSLSPRHCDHMRRRAMASSHGHTTGGLCTAEQAWLRRCCLDGCNTCTLRHHPLQKLEHVEHEGLPFSWAEGFNLQVHAKRLQRWLPRAHC